MKLRDWISRRLERSARRALGPAPQHKEVNPDSTEMPALAAHIKESTVAHIMETAECRAIEHELQRILCDPSRR